MQVQPNNQKVFPELEGQNAPNQQEIDLQRTALNTPSTDVPSYPMNDDDKPPFVELPIQDKKPSPTPKEPKHLLPRCSIDEEKVRKYLGCSILLLMFVTLALIIKVLTYSPYRDIYPKNPLVPVSSVDGALAIVSSGLISLASKLDDAHPILDIQVQDDGTACPTDYDSIKLGTWPGTSDGCDCGWRLSRGYCNREWNSSELHCADVYPRNAIDMYDWGGSNWCVKKAKLGSQYKKAVECPTGFKKCSSGICVENTLNCPVTKVKIQSTGTYKLETGTNRYVVPEITVGESPVVDLKITPNDVSCFNTDFANGPIGQYALINQNEGGCGRYGLDQNSFKLDTMKQKSLFDENSFPSTVYDLPAYAYVYENTDSVLSYRRRMNLAESDFCLNIDTEILVKSLEPTRKVEKWRSATSIGAIIIHSLLIALMGMMYCKLQSDFLKKEYITTWLWPYLVVGLIELAVLLLMFAKTTQSRGEMVGSHDYLMKITEENCFLDSQAQAVLNDYQVVSTEVVETIFKYSLALVIIHTSMVLTCIYLLFKNHRHYGKY